VRAAGLGVVDRAGVFDDGVAGFTVVGATVGAVVAVGAFEEFGAEVDGAELADVAEPAKVTGAAVSEVIGPEVTPADAVAAGITALMAMPVPSAVATPMLSEAAIARPRGAACGRRPR
jgi:hypothetical protein